METHRCAELILRGLYYKIPEMWISEQPFLALTYLGVYMPWINRQLMVRIIGPARVQMLKSGGNILDFKVC